MLHGAMNILVAGTSVTSECIQQALAGHFSAVQYHHVETRRALQQALENKHWTMMFTEIVLKDFTANELPALFKQYDLILPVALIASTDAAMVAPRCMEYGLCQLIQCDKQYLHYLPATIDALLKRARQEQRQRLIEQQLIESEERYLDIFNNTSDLIQCIAPDGSFIYTNTTWRKAMGYTQEEIQSLNLIDVLHPESRKCCQDRFERLKQGVALAAIDFRFVTKSDKTLHLTGDCGALIKKGEVISTRGIFRNVTETVRAELALKRSEARYQTKYDLAPDIYTTINNKGIILTINQTGVELLGYSKDELVGKLATIVIHPEDQQRVLAHVQTIFNNDKDDDGIEYRKVKKSGEVIWVHQRVTLDNTTDEQRLLIICRDITVRRELQEKLVFHATHDSLTHLINRRELEYRLQRVLSETSATDEHALCFLDLDEFKIVNDTHGHAAGDELLRQVTRLLREQMRSRDTLARIGGDEFIILMEHCPLDGALKLAAKLQKIISGYQFRWRGAFFTIGLSIGVTGLQQGATVESALSIADEACYKAKENGRNCMYVHQ